MHPSEITPLFSVYTEKMLKRKKDKGITNLLLILLVALFFLSFFIIKNSTPISIELNKETPSPTPTPTISTTPTPSPTITATPKPTVTATPSTAPAPAGVSGPPGAGYSYITVQTEKGNFSASVLSVDLNSARAITDTANDSDCADNCPVMNLQDFVNRNGGFAGVNGTYFCPAEYPECSGKKNSFDFPVYNTRLGKWINGGNLFWNGRSIVYFDGSGAHYMQNANSFGGGLTAGIVNYPGLLYNGNVQIDDSQSGLSDKQKAVGLKMGIGIISEKRVIIVGANSVNMQQFAYVFKALGARSALNLDTGGSTALYYNGRYYLGPGRNLPNAIIFAR